MKMKYTLILMVFIAALGFSQENPSWAYVLSDRGIEILGDGPAVIPLSRSGSGTLHPTPGGKYVYVSFSNSDEIIVFDVENRSEEWTFSLGFVPDRIVFSEMGETAYISNLESNEIKIYRS